MITGAEEILDILLTCYHYDSLTLAECQGCVYGFKVALVVWRDF